VRNIVRVLVTCTCVLVSMASLQAQQMSVPATTSVPRVIRITGSFAPVIGVPFAPVEIVTLSVYASETGGAPLWQETQQITIDGGGQYNVLLGAATAEGVPLEIFASGDALWLAVRIERFGAGEPPRARLTSVPYALRASDAETLGGRPASDYSLATGAVRKEALAGGSASVAAPPGTSANLVQTGTDNFLAKYLNMGADVGNSAVYEAAGKVGLGTMAPLDTLHVRFNSPGGAFTGYAVQNTALSATAYSGMLFYDNAGALAQFQGFNNNTHEYRINNIASGGTINFMIGSASKFLVGNNGDISIQANLLKSGARYLYTAGDESLFLGTNAGSLTSTSSHNTGVGIRALTQVTSGAANTAVGWQALSLNTTGFTNTAVGRSALGGNQGGSDNAALGNEALASNQVGNANTAVGALSLRDHTQNDGNTAVGFAALIANGSGSLNTAVGYLAGSNNPTGSGNIYLGADVLGTAESNAMYLGNVAVQTKTVIAGVRAVTTGIGDAVTVMIDSSGQLGTVNSSRRFKEDIQDMGNASAGLLKLRPVTFRYAQAYADGSKPTDYGLIAEEVQVVYPDLVTHSADGKVETVQYHKINAMLLNEVQKQHRALEEQRRELEAQRLALERLTARIAALDAERK